MDFNHFVDQENFNDHSTFLDLKTKSLEMNYKRKHRLLSDGDFVLAVNEGENNGVHSSFYDLFRLENHKIVEHRDTTEKVAPKSEWKNNNGKF
ncbi:MAG: putative SnoaL-like aldol condensation-catalyzing enzyme [Bacteriovoracaceae bacterium]|jgi:predicted SnoaL-like aldol condensation-catalyzing enzyme